MRKLTNTQHSNDSSENDRSDSTDNRFLSESLLGILTRFLNEIQRSRFHESDGVGFERRESRFRGGRGSGFFGSCSGF